VHQQEGPNYRTPRITPRPVIPGPQTAVVVGASGNEIETDKHGRIKVQFHWDRLGKNDQNSSCWVRVVHPFAGKGYGMFALPRVKDEVVVHFLDGDPDRPLVIGAVYNNDNMMQWTLPSQSTLSGFKSRSSKGGKEEHATSCASTTRRTASTSGSTPSATSTARSSTTRSTGSATTNRSTSR
jgi:type VI secretion system secreted protein VgrG